jgi:hypothetical protein
MTATAVSALTRHAAQHADVLRNGEPTIERPTGLRRAA